MLILPLPSYAVSLMIGRNQRILGSHDTRTVTGLAVAYRLPSPLLSRGKVEGAFSFEAFALTTRGQGHTRDRTEFYGFWTFARFSTPTRFRYGAYFEIGSGTAYSTQPADGVPLQFNFAPTVGLGVFVGQKPSVELGVRLTHISNGNTKSPNRGLDLLTATVGIRF